MIAGVGAFTLAAAMIAGVGAVGAFTLVVCIFPPLIIEGFF
jgi:hypothetical protein